MAGEEQPRKRFAPVWVAVVSAWLVPGLGHILLGRLRRGLLFAAVVWCCFGLGLLHTGRFALKDPRQPFLTTLQVVANLGMGPADAVARMKIYGEAAYSVHQEKALPGRESRIEIFRARETSAVAIYGTAYLWTAGLMNLLLLFDVWDIGRRRRS
jgi:hypothetical protein